MNQEIVEVEARISAAKSKRDEIQKKLYKLGIPNLKRASRNSNSFDIYHSKIQIKDSAMVSALSNEFVEVIGEIVGAKVELNVLKNKLNITGDGEKGGISHV